jgi:hypothetical protein
MKAHSTTPEEFPTALFFSVVCSLGSSHVVILGQRQVAFCGMNHYKVMPIPPALLLSWEVLPPDVSVMPPLFYSNRFILGQKPLNEESGYV